MLESRYLVTVLLATCFITEIYSQKPKVIGGRNAKEGEFPFQVSLQHYRIRQHLCGGAIINARVVMGPTHCLQAKIARTLVAVAGIHRLSDQTNAIVRNVGSIFYSYLDWFKKNPKEVALLTIKGVFPFDDKKLASVPIMTDYVNPGSILTVVGWGISGDQGATVLESGKVLGMVSGKVDNCATLGKPSVFSAVGDVRRWVKLATLSGAAGTYTTSPTWIELTALLLAAKIAMEL